MTLRDYQQTARHLYAENFTFPPVCKIWLFLNHKPRVDDDSVGFWRRVKLIPFNRTFEPKEQDRNLTEKLSKESPGILAWLVRGCLLWQQEGLEPTPPAVSLATIEYQAENDLLADFLLDACEEQEGAIITALELYQTYMSWSEKQGLVKKNLLSQTAFGRRMNDKKYKKDRMQSGIYKNKTVYHGIKSKKTGKQENPSIEEFELSENFTNS